MYDNVQVFIISVVVILFLLYVVIETAVRRGINSSVIGQFLEKHHGIKGEKKSFLDKDLDNDK
ncbi:hypothetical protein ACLM5H_07345 [Fredinandcohnia humi]